MYSIIPDIISDTFLCYSLNTCSEFLFFGIMRVLWRPASYISLFVCGKYIFVNGTVMLRRIPMIEYEKRLAWRYA